MAKFLSVQDVNFQRVVSVLRRWIDELGQVKTGDGASAAAYKDKFTLPDGLIFDEQYHACLRSLNHVDARKRVKDVEPAYSATYDWLLNDSIGFDDWLKGKNPSPVFWIQGKPASGKSTLMKFALNHRSTLKHLNTNSKARWIVASYFFHDRGTTIQKSVEGFLCEILFQVLNQQRELFPLIYPIFCRWDLADSEAHPRDELLSESLADTWSIEDMEKALMLIATKSTFETNICLFVDALDEHDGNHRELISILKHFAQSTGNPFFRVRLCLTGRPLNVFTDAFRSYPGFAIHEHTTQDIRLYAEERIKDGMGSRLTDKGAHELDILVQNIIERAEGVFLWVKLVVNELIDGLCEGDDIEELRDLLSTIPTELEDLFTRAIRRNRPTSLRRIDKHRIEAYVMFQIVLHARNPFGINELLAATHFLVIEKENYHELPERLSLDQMRRRLNSRSAGLLEALSRKSRTRDEQKVSNFKVQFIHQTVKEFMLTSTGSMVICEGLHGPPKDSGFLLIFRYLLSLLRYCKSDNLDISARDFVATEFLYYAQKVDSETGRSGWQHLEPSISSFTDQQLCDVLSCIDRRLRHDSHGYISRNVRLVLLFVCCGLHHSLGEFVSSRTTEFTDKDVSDIFNNFFAITWDRRRIRCLESLLETGLGARLSSDDFLSHDRSIPISISEYDDSRMIFFFENSRAQQLWEQLRKEKESCL